jgi:hypothetical protein
MSRALDITGEKYGRLTALENTKTKDSNGSFIWKWQFDCGNVIYRGSGNIRSRAASSCGCFNREATGDRARTHGMSKSSEHKSWCKINERCYNVKSPDYKDYGEKGITSDFRNSFEEFLKEIGTKPNNSKWSVDRIDNDLGYVKGNIRWASDTQQARNKGKPKNNTSGEVGVTFDLKNKGTKNEALYAKAYWRTLQGNSAYKRFSARELGIMEAFKQAVTWRRLSIIELNYSGAGYSQKHGK